MSQGKEVRLPQGLQIALCWASNWNNPSQSLNVRAVEEKSHTKKDAVCTSVTFMWEGHIRSLGEGSS